MHDDTGLFEYFAVGPDKIPFKAGDWSVEEEEKKVAFPFSSLSLYLQNANAEHIHKIIL